MHGHCLKFKACEKSHVSYAVCAVALRRDRKRVLRIFHGPVANVTISWKGCSAQQQRLHDPREQPEQVTAQAL